MGLNLSSTMKKSIYIVSLLLMTGLFSCDGIFVPDPIDPRLPKYTEEGNNVAGAFVDDVFWKSVVGYHFAVTDRPQMILFPPKDSLVLYFYGSTQDKSATIEFHLKGSKVTQFNDLAAWEGKKILLDGTSGRGIYNDCETSTEFRSQTGQFYLKHVDLVKGIISGTFGFTAIDKTGKIIKVKSGRFDYTEPEILLESGEDE